MDATPGAVAGGLQRLKRGDAILFMDTNERMHPAIVLERLPVRRGAQTAAEAHYLVQEPQEARSYTVSSRNIVSVTPAGAPGQNAEGSNSSSTSAAAAASVASAAAAQSRRNTNTSTPTRQSTGFFAHADTLLAPYSTNPSISHAATLAAEAVSSPRSPAEAAVAASLASPSARAAGSPTVTSFPVDNIEGCQNEDADEAGTAAAAANGSAHDDAPASPRRGISSLATGAPMQAPIYADTPEGFRAAVVDRDVGECLRLLHHAHVVLLSCVTKRMYRVSLHYDDWVPLSQQQREIVGFIRNTLNVTFPETEEGFFAALVARDGAEVSRLQHLGSRILDEAALQNPRQAKYLRGLGVLYSPTEAGIVSAMTMKDVAEARRLADLGHGRDTMLRLAQSVHGPILHSLGAPCDAVNGRRRAEVIDHIAFLRSVGVHYPDSQQGFWAAAVMRDVAEMELLAEHGPGVLQDAALPPDSTGNRTADWPLARFLRSMRVTFPDSVQGFRAAFEMQDGDELVRLALFGSDLLLHYVQTHNKQDARTALKLLQIGVRFPTNQAGFIGACEMRDVAEIQRLYRFATRGLLNDMLQRDHGFRDFFRESIALYPFMRKLVSGDQQLLATIVQQQSNVPNWSVGGRARQPAFIRTQHATTAAMDQRYTQEEKDKLARAEGAAVAADAAAAAAAAYSDKECLCLGVGYDKAAAEQTRGGWLESKDEEDDDDNHAPLDENVDAGVLALEDQDTAVAGTSNLSGDEDDADMEAVPVAGVTRRHKPTRRRKSPSKSKSKPQTRMTEETTTALTQPRVPDRPCCQQKAQVKQRFISTSTAKAREQHSHEEAIRRQRAADMEKKMSPPRKLRQRKKRTPVVPTQATSTAKATAPMTSTAAPAAQRRQRGASSKSRKSTDTNGSNRQAPPARRQRRRGTRRGRCLESKQKESNAEIQGRRHEDTRVTDAGTEEAKQEIVPRAVESERGLGPEQEGVEEVGRADEILDVDEPAATGYNLLELIENLSFDMREWSMHVRELLVSNGRHSNKFTARSVGTLHLGSGSSHTYTPTRTGGSEFGSNGSVAPTTTTASSCDGDSVQEEACSIQDNRCSSNCFGVAVGDGNALAVSNQMAGDQAWTNVSMKDLVFLREIGLQLPTNEQGSAAAAMLRDAEEMQRLAEHGGNTLLAAVPTRQHARQGEGNLARWLRAMGVVFPADEDGLRGAACMHDAQEVRRLRAHGPLVLLQCLRADPDLLPFLRATHHEMPETVEGLLAAIRLSDVLEVQRLRNQGSELLAALALIGGCKQGGGGAIRPGSLGEIVLHSVAGGEPALRLTTNFRRANEVARLLRILRVRFPDSSAGFLAALCLRDMDEAQRLRHHGGDVLVRLVLHRKFRNIDLARELRQCGVTFPSSADGLTAALLLKDADEIARLREQWGSRLMLDLSDQVQEGRGMAEDGMLRTALAFGLQFPTSMQGFMAAARARVVEEMIRLERFAREGVHRLERSSSLELVRFTKHLLDVDTSTGHRVRNPDVEEELKRRRLAQLLTLERRSRRNGCTVCPKT